MIIRGYALFGAQSNQTFFRSQNPHLQIPFFRRFASFNAAKELPFDSEDAFLLWLNKINVTNDSKIQKKVPTSESKKESPRRFRFKRDQLIEKTPKLFPKIDDLQKDIADGKALLSLIMFYCPDVISTKGELSH